MPAKIRKIIVQTDEVRVEMGRDVQPPVRKALALSLNTHLTLPTTPYV